MKEILLSLIMMFGVSGVCAQTSDIKVEYMTEFTVEAFDAHQKDMIYVINFWSTRCGPCLSELHHFQAIQDRFKDKRVQVILVSLDFNGDANRIEPALKTCNIHAPTRVIHLIDNKLDTWIPQIDPEWDAAMPFTQVYLANGRASSQLFQKEGYSPIWGEISGEIDASEPKQYSFEKMVEDIQQLIRKRDGVVFNAKY